MTKEVMKKEANELVDVSVFEGTSSGFENTDASTFKTPFLKILQALSPELAKKDAKYVEGAEVGQYYNTATQEVYDNIDVVVLKIDHRLLVWKPNREGFVGSFPKTEEKKIVSREDGVQKWDKEGNSIVDTIELYCININNPADLFIFPLAISGLTYGQKFATRLRGLTANGKLIGKTWAGVWNISTVEEDKGKGPYHTLGLTPKFVRFINMEEKTMLIEPAIEMLKTADTDYTIVEGTKEGDAKEESTEDVSY